MNTSPVKLFRQAKKSGEKVVMISLYDAPTAALAADAGADTILVGDSMGNVVLGYDGTVAVTMESMLHHTEAVSRGVRSSENPGIPIVSDLPFAAYATAGQAAENAARLMRAGANAVKLEGSGPLVVEAASVLTQLGVPVMGHLGYTPQSSNNFEGVVQGKTNEAASLILDGAKRLQEAGCFGVVLEVVPSEVAARVTGELSISTVGIGAGPDTDAQVLVWHDLVGLSPKKLRFARRYAEAHELLSGATRDFVREVKGGGFPGPENGWAMDPEELESWS
ncbi:3-methyl-2-oxobutanoate hydroxymethyltransferase [Rubrobacter indicoceani]|uniref:3-methyl-2-oxobutanoate hydroxymethyltransferase n=1 Tax=Rubrobacter indicoceani TaxID=2051957 RepID=UPI000E5C4233|nr:3-methyl-2-oxobutanoate hydroxymethyltransferase [Rubrobacter indicoceani]